MAFAGSICDVGLKVPSDFDTNCLKRGNVICDPEHPIKLIREFIAHVMIFDSPDQAITMGTFVTVHSYSSKGTGKMSKLIGIID